MVLFLLMLQDMHACVLYIHEGAMIWTDGLPESGDDELAYQESLYEVHSTCFLAIAMYVSVL